MCLKAHTLCRRLLLLISLSLSLSPHLVCLLFLSRPPSSLPCMLDHSGSSGWSTGEVPSVSTSMSTGKSTEKTKHMMTQFWGVHMGQCHAHPLISPHYPHMPHGMGPHGPRMFAHDRSTVGWVSVGVTKVVGWVSVGVTKVVGWVSVGVGWGRLGSRF